ncbi:hypothetical protein [uncultured Campylobacter sp.]|uniref:hypothetical protein n=1 Tax=uncultured Campylobacter sp. TaxID=218934 RepID=UPI0026206FC1|nr:hypothetical protein [uncultured Campylobacter sp.]
MADKEFTQICKEVLAAAEKITPLAEQAGKLVEQIEQQKSELQAAVASANEAMRKALQSANEQASQTLAAAQSQAEQTANLAKEATEQNAASAKSAQQKAAEILASIEKLQEQIKATADKVENAGALLTELNSLKEQIKTLLQNGIINDEAQSATQTYSSNLIERKLETKAGVGYGYSKIEANAKFETLAQGVNTAISAAAAAQSSAAGKLGKDEQAADSKKLGGAEAEKFLRADVKSVAALGVGIGANGSDIAPSGNDLRVFSAKKGGKVILRGTGSDAVARDIKLNPSNAVIELGNFKFQGSLGGASAVFDQTALVPFFKADNLWRAVSFAKLASTVYDVNETEIAKELGKKLGKDEAASDSAKLIGVEGANFHRKDGANGSKITTITSLEVDLTQGDNFVLNLGAPGKLTLKNGAVGQSGALIVRNATNITGYDAALGFRVVPTGLKATEVFAYFVVSENEIKIGRV